MDVGGFLRAKGMTNEWHDDVFVKMLRIKTVAQLRRLTRQEIIDAGARCPNEAGESWDLSTVIDDTMAKLAEEYVPPAGAG